MLKVIVMGVLEVLIVVEAVVVLDVAVDVEAVAVVMVEVYRARGHDYDC